MFVSLSTEGGTRVGREVQIKGLVRLGCGRGRSGAWLARNESSKTKNTEKGGAKRGGRQSGEPRGAARENQRTGACATWREEGGKGGAEWDRDDKIESITHRRIRDTER